MMAARMARMTVRRMHRRRRRRRRRRVLLVGGLVALGAYKLTKKDTERVEEHTGKKAEELTDEELEQAMDQLGIEAEEMSDEEMDYVDKADPPEEMDYVDKADPPEEDDYIEELERLADLREKGIITDEEFEAKKQQLLGL